MFRTVGVSGHRPCRVGRLRGRGPQGIARARLPWWTLGSRCPSGRACRPCRRNGLARSPRGAWRRGRGRRRRSESWWLDRVGAPG